MINSIHTDSLAQVQTSTSTEVRFSPMQSDLKQTVKQERRQKPTRRHQSQGKQKIERRVSFDRRRSNFDQEA